MNVTCIYGSPAKKSKSTTLAKIFLNALRKSRVETDEFMLNDLNYKGCQACMACKSTSEKCVVPDDMQDVLESVRKCDLLVLATPVYYGDVSSQMKGFIDRTFSYLRSGFMERPDPCRLEPGKKLVFIIMQGAPDTESFEDVFPRYKFFFKFYGFQDIHLIRGCGIETVTDSPEWKRVRQEAQDIAAKLSS